MSGRDWYNQGRFYVCLAALLLTVAGAWAAIYARLCVVETVLDVLAERVGRIEERLAPAKAEAPAPRARTER